MLAVVLLVELIVVLPSFLLFPRLNFLAEVLPAVLVNLTNQEREIAKLPDLTTDPLLTEAAQAKATDMAGRGYFAHNDPTSGAEPWVWLDRAGYRYDFAGENLAVNFIDSNDVLRAWMQSPTHRENIVRSSFSQIGIGVASGVYQGRPSVFVVQFFGRPAFAEATAGKPALIIPPQSTAGKPALIVPPQSTAAVAPTPITPPVKPIAVSLPNVKGESTPALQPLSGPKLPTFWQKWLAEPRTTNTALLLLLMFVVIAALALNILIQIKIQHPDLVANGLAVICLIGALLLVNNHWSRASVQISDRAAASIYLSTP